MIKAPTNLVPALEALLGPSSVLSDAAARASYAVDEIIPSVVAKPSSPEQAAELVRFAALENLALIPCGARTKLQIGSPPSRYDIALDMTSLDQIVHYDPGDLTLSAGAGTPIAKLNATLLEHRQFLPLLVPWYSRSTIGGTIASGIDSPLRQFFGTARDFLIGAEFVDGTGKLCKSGGRVVKNVTGYDLHKLLIGSLGTLAVITRLNFRTFPSVIAGSRGFVASFPNAQCALALRRAILQSPLTPLTLDILSPGLAQIFSQSSPATPEAPVFSGEARNAGQASLPPIGDWFRPGEWQLCAAFAGTPEALVRYTRVLTRFAEDSRATSTAFLDDTTRPAVWGRLRETLSMLLESSPATVIFKISVLPSRYAALFSSLRQIADRNALPHALLARADGSVYFALLPASTDQVTTGRVGFAAVQVRNSVCDPRDRTNPRRGHTSLLFAPSDWKRVVTVPDGGEGFAIDLWGRPLLNLALMQRLKSAFDPQTILAPGRFFTPSA
jgi:glycolate oxidase FAD binding subunit